MNPDLVDAYWRRYSLRWGANDTQFADEAVSTQWDWADWEVRHVVRAGNSEAVALVVALAAAAPSEEGLGFLGSGPLEDLVNGYGVLLMDELDHALDVEPKLRVALSYVRVGVEYLEADTRLKNFFEPPRDAEGRLP